MFDWSPYLIGGGTRPDAMTGLHSDFATALATMFSAAPEDIRQNLRINSAYRDTQTQQRLWDEALKKYGSPEAARKWVAPPGRSQHNHGMAADLKYLSPAAQEWVAANAARYGLAFPLSNENWHVELAGARGTQMADVPPSKRPPSAEPGILPREEMPSPTWGDRAGILGDALMASMPEPAQTPQIMQVQVAPYQPVKRDQLAIYQRLFGSLG